MTTDPSVDTWRAITGCLCPFAGCAGCPYVGHARSEPVSADLSDEQPSGVVPGATEGESA